jgi:glutathione S-transferase
MADLKIYGIPKSRAVRVIWMAEELGIPYDNELVTMADKAHKGPAYLAVNPNGRLPAIDDNGFRMSESLAINLYLAKKHGRFYPKSLEDEARCWQWSHWTVFELDKQANDWAAHDHVLPAPQRDPAKLKAAREVLDVPLGVLDRLLASRQYLVTPDQFTVADLNVAAALYRCINMDFGAMKNVARWYKACWERPAAKKARDIRERF